jgi:type IX secretion system PorP/SprF family membrane protein
MKLKFYILFLLNLLLFPIVATSQSYPLFSQYVSNGLILNPAYTGSREVLSISLMHRSQWYGFEGASDYQTLSAHAPLKNNRVAIGCLFLNEQYGKLHNTHAYINYAYRINLGNSKLALGLKAGANMINYNFNNTYVNEPDYTFAGNESYILPNFGAGTYLYSSTYFIGISVPYLLSYDDGYKVYHNMDNYDYLFTGGYVFNVANVFKVKPTTLIKYSKTAKEQVDLNMNLIFFKDKLWIGGAYRIGQAYASTLEIQFNPQFRFGYSFEYTKSDIPEFNYTSHEISIRYEFSYKIKAFNPRYF